MVWALVGAFALLAGCANGSDRIAPSETGPHGAVEEDLIRCTSTATLNWSRDFPENISVEVHDGGGELLLVIDDETPGQSANVEGAPGTWRLSVVDGLPANGPHGSPSPPGNQSEVKEGTGGVGGQGYWVTIACD